MVNSDPGYAGWRVYARVKSRKVGEEKCPEMSPYHRRYYSLLDDGIRLAIAGLISWSSLLTRPFRGKMIPFAGIRIDFAFSSGEGETLKFV